MGHAQHAPSGRRQYAEPPRFDILMQSSLSLQEIHFFSSRPAPMPADATGARQSKHRRAARTQRRHGLQPAALQLGAAAGAIFLPRLAAPPPLRRAVSAARRATEMITAADDADADFASMMPPWSRAHFIALCRLSARHDVLSALACSRRHYYAGHYFRYAYFNAIFFSCHADAAPPSRRRQPLHHRRRHAT